jgi:hypothetical protein
MHGVQESSAKETSAEKRIEWDIKEIEEIFRVLELSLTRGDIKFSRRVGKKGESQGAYCWILHRVPDARSVLLKYTKYLAETDYENVSVMLDLTRRQRQEETTMKEEAERRNEEELTDDDLAKNLCWKQCCGSGMFIPDPGSGFFPSRIRVFPIPDPGSRIPDPGSQKTWGGKKIFLFICFLTFL